MDITPQYAEWLSSGLTGKALIEAVSIQHPAWTPNIFLVRWPTPITLTHEGGQAWEYQAADFRIEPVAVKDSTEQSVQATIRALDGALYEELMKLDWSDRSQPIRITHRVYLEDDYAAPLITPPPLWYVQAIEVGHDYLRADLTSVPLRTRRIGLYYTINEFDCLRYV